jgi:hypothetical protein
MATTLAVAAPDAPATSDLDDLPRGDGLIVGGAIVGGMTVLGRVPVSIIGIRNLTCYARTKDGDLCEESGLVGTFQLFGATGFLGGAAVSLGLLGAGLERRGRWQADVDAAYGRPMRRFGVGREVAGWTLLGAGLGVWAGSAIGAWVGCGSDPCSGYTQELGFYGGATLVGTGIALAPYAKGYREVAARRGWVSISAAPTASRTGFGISLSGRF